MNEYIEVYNEFVENGQNTANKHDDNGNYSRCTISKKAAPTEN